MGLEFIIPDTICNQNCIFCKVEKSKHKQLSTKDIKEILILKKENGINSIIIGGGEPTLRKDLCEIIKFAKYIGLKIKIQTNGTILANKRITDNIIAAGIDSIMVSLHTHNETIYDTITQSSNNYKKALDGITNLNGHNIEIGISHVINTLNIDMIENYLTFIHNTYPYIDYFHFGIVYPLGNAKDNDTIIPPYSKVKKCLDIAYKFCRKHNIKMIIQGVPLCVIEKYMFLSSEFQRRIHENNKKTKEKSIINSQLEEKLFNKSKVHIDKCNSCSLKNNCEGIWKRYIEIHKDNDIKTLHTNLNEIYKKTEQELNNSPIKDYLN